MLCALLFHWPYPTDSSWVIKLSHSWRPDNPSQSPSDGPLDYNSFKIIKGASKNSVVHMLFHILATVALGIDSLVGLLGQNKRTLNFATYDRTRLYKCSAISLSGMSKI